MTTDAVQTLDPGTRPSDERRLRRLLALALGILLVAMLANFSYTLWSDRNDRLSDAEKATRNLARVIEEQTASMVNAAEFSLSSAERRLARIPEEERLGTPAAHEVLRDNLRAMPFGRAMFVLDAEGRLLHDSQGFPAAPASHAERDYFQVHRNGPHTGLFIGAPGAAEDGFISISRRQEDAEGHFIGVAVVAIDPQYLTAFYQKVDLGANGAIGLFLRNGSVLARAAPTDARVRTAFAHSELFTQMLPRATIGSYRSSPALDGIERIVSYRSVQSRPLVVAVGLGQDDVLASWRSKAWVFASIALALVALVVRLGVLVFRELTRREQLAAMLRAREHDLSTTLVEARISAIAFQTQEMIVITDADRCIVRANDAFMHATGYAAADLVGQPVAMLHAHMPDRDEAFYDELRETVRRDGAWQGEVRCCRKNGNDFPARLTVSAVVDADATRQVTHFVNVLSDITKDKESEQRIHRLAFYDPLTHLPNRSLLRDRLQQTLARSGRDKRHGALLFLDLDHFKLLNDTRGHGVGDMLLVEVANRLRHCVRASDTVARLGGDEFILLLGDLSPDPLKAPIEARHLADKVLDSLHQPFVLADIAHHSSASIGIAVFGDDGTGVDELLQQADLAMYQAKAGGRNALRFFDVGMQEALQRRVALESELREALRQQQLLLHYQPVVQDAGRVTGAEALVRWQHPTRGMVPPGEFIGLAEASGLIVPLGQWVLQTACAQLAAWARQPALAGLTLSVNVSAHQFREADFVARVHQALDAAGADPRLLKLELTETLLAHDVEDVIVKMAALKTRGVSFSLDDFGTGYSSLSYLKRLPLGQLKIDQSFVRDVLLDPNDAAIARTIVLLGQSLGLEVVAEGVETEGQRQFLADNGCTGYQGYLFSRPLPIAQFDDYVMHPSKGQRTP